MGWIVFSVYFLFCFFLVYLSVLFFGSYFIRWNFYGIATHRIDSSIPEPCVALTFDDGIHELTPKILDILKTYEVEASFFLIGKNIKSHASCLKRMYQEGHTIGNHSFNHSFIFDWQSSAKMLEEMKKTNEIIMEISGYEPLIFRPPYGVTNPNLAKAIKQSGMQSVGWSLRSMDTVAKSDTQLLQKILNKVRDKDIILLHDRCAITLQILPALIKGLRQKGFKFVNLSFLKS